MTVCMYVYMYDIVCSALSVYVDVLLGTYVNGVNFPDVLGRSVMLLRHYITVLCGCM